MGEKAIELHGCPMTAEDFSILSNEVPAVYLKLGTAGSNRETQFPLHSSSFDVDPACFETGLLAVSGIMLDYLGAFSA